jgi:hypothetical protein
MLYPLSYEGGTGQGRLAVPRARFPEALTELPGAPAATAQWQTT